jgi:hypothetical protein
MKKKKMNRIKLFSSVVFTFFTLVIFGQTIVSTSSENKKVVLEEFTGIHCTFCPDGHAIAQGIQNNNPENVFLINIHTGSYANPGSGEPDFRTPFGAAIASQSGLVGYPAGTVNRTNFPGMEQGSSGTTAMSRGSWPSAANTTMDEESYVNVGVEADINVSTNEITIHVEAYYTGNSPESTNLLNVALLQNNTLGPQTGGGMGNQYNHMHRLVYLITGQWGVSIPTTTTGTFVDETFTYTIPADYNGVPTAIENLEVVTFITETHQELPSGNGAYPTYSGFAHANDAKIRYVEDILPQCGFDITPKVNIQNYGENDLTDMEITYSVNGGTPQIYNWTGLLLSLQNESIELPAISYTVEEINTINISISDDDDDTNNHIAYDFNISDEFTNTVNLILNTDNAGSQCTWDLMNSNGEVLYSGGPYANNENIQESFELVQDCYRFRVFDSGGNGGGSIVLYDSESEIIYNTPGNYGEGGERFFRTIGNLSINDNNLQNVIIYPNPTISILNIENAENSMIEIYDLLGRVVLSENNISINKQLNVSNLSAGTYLIKISNNNIIITDKFIINK